MTVKEWTEIHNGYVWEFEVDKERNETVVTPVRLDDYGKSESERIEDILDDIQSAIDSTRGNLP